MFTWFLASSAFCLLSVCLRSVRYKNRSQPFGIRMTFLPQYGLQYEYSYFMVYSCRKMNDISEKRGGDWNANGKNGNLSQSAG